MARPQIAQPGRNKPGKENCRPAFPVLARKVIAPAKQLAEKGHKGLVATGLQTAIGDSRATDGALKCAATTPKSKAPVEKTGGRYNFNGKVKGAQLKLAATKSKAEFFRKL
jgi:hypothetical protein